ncbi:MAG: hypothetical protein CMH57_08995 [Myxococcales bacterium]|nr:hypothetical protein [Myxococcales bacterium]
MTNPYHRWTTKRARHFVGHQREQFVTDIMEEVLQGGSVALYGGHGMGKSALLLELETRLTARPDVRVARLVSAPSTPDQTALQALAWELGVPTQGPYLDPRAVLTTWVVNNRSKQLILLYDELDTYLELPGIVKFFSALENALQEEELADIGLVGAGGLGLIFLGAKELGSAFMSRAVKYVLEAFTYDDIKALCQRGFDTPLADDALDTLWRLSGGNPALVTYGLERLWRSSEAERTAAHVTQLFDRFIHRDGSNFLDRLEASVSVRNTFQSPGNLLKLFMSEIEPYQEETLATRVGLEDLVEVNVKNCLDILLASGLIRVRGEPHNRPLLAQPIHSILLQRFRTSRSSLLEPQPRLQEDLTEICTEIHRLAVDFYKGQNDDRTLVEEATFSAVIAIGLRMRGWPSQREAIQVAGRTDIRADSVDGSGHVITEVKLWGRKHKTVHRQVVAYSTSETRALAVVMIADHLKKEDGWCAAYIEACLSDFAEEDIERISPEGADVLILRVQDTPLPVLHILVPVPRR